MNYREDVNYIEGEYLHKKNNNRGGSDKVNYRVALLLKIRRWYLREQY